MSMHATPIPGAITLLGSGEYLEVMNDVDAYLLETIGGPQAAHVALIPAASGLELMGPASWNKLGLEHFRSLGVVDIRATKIVDHASANDLKQLALLQDANFFYFSGGNPQHLLSTLQGSLAWEYILTAYEQGAVLAGCSAGAMVMGGQILSMRQAMAGSIHFTPSLGLIPHIIVLPHFDRMAGFVDQTRFQQIIQSVPGDYLIVGIDEDTALVRINHHDKANNAARWRVMGRQTVSLISRDRQTHVIGTGKELFL